MWKPNGFVLICLGLACLAPSSLADVEPRIGSVDPDRGPEDEDRRILVTGDGFASSANLALLTGGVYIAGSSSVAADPVAVAKGGSFVFVADRDFGLRVFELSSDGRPRPVAELPLSGPVTAIALAGDQVVVMASDRGLEIIGVRDPQTPVLLATFGLPGKPTGIAAREGLAVVGTLGAGVHIVDLEKPAKPVWIGSCQDCGVGEQMTLEGRFAYFTRWSKANSKGPVPSFGRVDILDLGDPAHPTRRGGVSALRVDGLLAEENLLYVAGSDLSIYDVTDPDDPVSIGWLTLPESTHGLAKSGDRLLLGHGDNALFVIDVADPTAPRLETAAAAPAVIDLAASSGIAAAGTTDSGLVTFDYSEPAPPRLAWLPTWQGEKQTTTFEFDGAVAVAGDLALIGKSINWGSRHTSGYLRIVDLSDPESLDLVSSTWMWWPSSDIAVAGSMAYLAYAWTGLKLVDIGDPARPEPKGEAELPDYATGVAVKDAHAYVVTRSGGLFAVDVSDPEAPTQVAQLPLQGEGSGLALAENTLLIAAGSAGLVVVDIDVPSAPEQVAQLITGEPISGVAVAGDLALLAAGAAGMQVISVADRKAPVKIGTFASRGSVSDLAVRGTLAYLAEGKGGVEVVDVSDPARPRLIDHFPTTSTAVDVALGKRHVAVVNGRGGLLYWRQNHPPRDLSVLSARSLEATIPAGRAPGAYHVAVSNGDHGGSARLFNGYHVIRTCALSARLEPRLGPDPGGNLRAISTPVRFRLLLEGDPIFFEPTPSHRAEVLLPDLPDSLEERERRGNEPGVTTIDLRLWPDQERGVVQFTSDDPANARATWEQIREAGRISIPAIDERSYGDLELSVSRRQPREDVRQAPLPASDPIQTRPRAPLVYRYRFVGDDIAAVSATGSDADIFIEVRATSPACSGMVDLGGIEELRRACEAWSQSHPEHVLDCPD